MSVLYGLQSFFQIRYYLSFKTHIIYEKKSLSKNSIGPLQFYNIHHIKTAKVVLVRFVTH